VLTPAGKIIVPWKAIGGSQAVVDETGAASVVALDASNPAITAARRILSAVMARP
jgi:hypothetical protein